jgi:hypothetical protein
LTVVQWGDDASEAPRVRPANLPAWGKDLAVQSVGSALGTLIAALVLFIGGAFFGIIENVDTASVLTALAALLGGLTAMASVLATTSSTARRRDMTALDDEIREARRLQDRSDAWVEKAKVHSDAVSGTVKRLRDEILVAVAAGDVTTSEAKLREVERLQDLMGPLLFDVEVAREQAERTARFVDRVEAHAGKYGFDRGEP